MPTNNFTDNDILEILGNSAPSSLFTQLDASTFEESERQRFLLSGKATSPATTGTRSPPSILQILSQVIREITSIRFTLRSLFLAVLCFSLILGVTTFVGRTIRTNKRNAIHDREDRVVRFLEHSLSSAVSIYSIERGHGHLPTANQKSIEFHLMRNYPRCLVEREVEQAGIDFSTVDEAELLVFLVGGMPANDSSRTVTGYGVNPSHPLTDNAERVPPYHDFHCGGVLVDCDNDGWLEYSTGTLHNGRQYFFGLFDDTVKVYEPVLRSFPERFAR